MTRRSTTILAILFCVAFAATFLPRSSAQPRDRFSHASAAHKKIDCASCHKIPTSNWATARGYPDSAQFPGHAACVKCHTRDFFVGNKPVFCAGCHTNAGPRGAPLFPFPVRTRSHEFLTIFPHSVHQDVIASTRKTMPVAAAHFVNAGFKRLPDDPPVFNNCAICHAPAKTLPKFEARVPVGENALAPPSAESFTPVAAFFKSMPAGHASCFQCHYQGVKPAAADCAGCHQLTSPYMESSIVKRYSLKFSHEETNDKGDKVHTRDCMTCHLRIAANGDLKTLKDADVPIMTCTACHNHAGDLKKELDSRAESIDKKTPPFQCTYCHTTKVGAYPVPASHDKQ